MHVSLISDEKIEELTQGTDYTITDRVVTLAAATALKIKIYRRTSTKPLVGWVDASVLKAADMTVQSTQLLHLAEETSDLAQDGGLSKDTTDKVWDAKFNKIKNLLDPTDPGDAVTLNYITKNQDSLLTQLKNTGATQNSSIVSTGDTQNARLTSTGDTQNTRLNTTGDTQDKRLNDLGQKYVDIMTTLKDTATTKATEASNSAELSKKWAMSDTSPDGVTGNKSSKTWAGEAKTSASNSASSASSSQSSANASQTSATQSASSANTASQKASASASSAKAAASSASAASTSASNAKTSETNAANSAKAAKQSEANAKTWDPVNRPYLINLAKPDNHGNRVLFLLEEIKDLSIVGKNRQGGVYSVYVNPRNGNNDNAVAPFVHIAAIPPYSKERPILWSTNREIYPLIVKENNTGVYYWGLSISGSAVGISVLASSSKIKAAIKTLNSDTDEDKYEGFSIIYTPDFVDPATTNWVTANFTASAVTNALAKTLSDTNANLEALTTKVDSHFNASGHLVLDGSELWIE